MAAERSRPDADTEPSSVTYPIRQRPRRRGPSFGRPALAPLDFGELAALSSLPLRARRLADAAGAGHHRSRRKGSNVEFADYREYQFGDDLRRVDWRLYGRTDRLQLREAHEETPLRVQLLLDVSRSMSFASRPGLWTKLDVARAALGAIALLTRRQRDACGLGLLSDDLLHYAPPSRSPATWRAVWGLLEKPALGTPTALASCLGRMADIAPKGCLFVIASDFYEEAALLEQVMRRMSFDGHDVLALHVADPAELDFNFTDPAEFADLESEQILSLDPVAAARGYRDAFAAHRNALAEAFRGCGFDWVELRTDAAPMNGLAAYLARRAARGA